ncbi:hypothetical protein, partial [Tenacibaculum piscium]|uniref:hypothetical protein n=1 Tax=Tenacibaculum piscium TaxID=1458515 RepID=UPI001F36524C
AINDAFEIEIERKKIKPVIVEQGLAILALVGICSHSMTITAINTPCMIAFKFFIAMWTNFLHFLYLH